MNYLTNIRIRLGAFILKQKLKKKKRTPVICNLKQAKNIGIVYDTSIANNRQSVTKLESYFKELEMNIEVLGYAHVKKEENTLIGDNHHHYIYAQDFNWYYKPKNEMIEHFIQAPLDIIINLYQEEEFAIEYIIKMSNAKFKVGCAHIEESLHDLMIDVSKHKGDTEYLIENVKHYLNILNN
ncbi:DUF6913 domain-containing protein [Saccharicrinis fermentans]|uniref:Uncharacterized protein n=1 Tax=Saccharicrinis fermentans DSM 9555 = JCM 21142 TaxID=869213 RepID=W7YIM1_9BACT|nr:hypothetical protein [Saccharicrinis fermentans]GAF04316.1 hypothetical protein JCM21142_73017 [Saccharicrinis fermentans DSM 9555 = JCM 21142]